MPEFLHPGVYIEEIESGPRPIEGVATSTAAFLGETERGPLRPRLVTGYNEYVRWFGGVFAPDKFMPHAVKGFFENGGKRAFICRIVNKPATVAIAKFNDLKVVAVGAGSWGTALAVHLGRIGHHVRLWARDRALVEDMLARRANTVYLPEVRLPDTVSVTHAIDEALGASDLVVSAIPSHGCRTVMRQVASHIRPRATIVSATKGLEVETLLRMSQVIAEELGPHRPVVVLSGPSFAIEVVPSGENRSHFCRRCYQRGLKTATAQRSELPT